VQNNVPKLRLELRKVSQLDKVVHSREVASLPIWGGGTASVSFDGDGKVEVIWQPVQAVNTYPDPELWAVVDVNSGALLPHKQRVLSGTAKAFEQLAAPFRPQLKDGKRGIINPAPHDATYAAQGPKLAVFTSAELVEHSWGPIVRDVVIAVVDPSSSKVLRRLVMPPSEPTRVHVELGPRGRALFVCLSQLGPFLFDLASGAGGRLGGGLVRRRRSALHTGRRGAADPRRHRAPRQPPEGLAERSCPVDPPAARAERGVRPRSQERRPAGAGRVRPRALQVRSDPRARRGVP
jgi:hypothetical protein